MKVQSYPILHTRHGILDFYVTSPTVALVRFNSFQSSDNDEDAHFFEYQHLETVTAAADLWRIMLS
jgi:hypothetical protein